MITITDLELQKTIVECKRTAPSLLHISPEQEQKRTYTFKSYDNFIYSCNINLEEARMMANPLVIDPKEGIGEIFKLENKEELFNMRNEHDSISRMWQKGQRRGFIIQKCFP